VYRRSSNEALRMKLVGQIEYGLPTGDELGSHCWLSLTPCPPPAFKCCVPRFCLILFLFGTLLCSNPGLRPADPPEAFQPETPSPTLTASAPRSAPFYCVECERDERAASGEASKIRSAFRRETPARRSCGDERIPSQLLTHHSDTIGRLWTDCRCDGFVW
jgi:hypothetical protein